MNFDTFYVSQNYGRPVAIQTVSDLMSQLSFMREFNIIRIIMKGFDLFFLGQHFKYFVFLLLKYSGRVIDQYIYSVTFTAIVSIM